MRSLPSWRSCGHRPDVDEARVDVAACYLLEPRTEGGAVVFGADGGVLRGGAFEDGEDAVLEEVDLTSAIEVPVDD